MKEHNGCMFEWLCMKERRTHAASAFKLLPLLYFALSPIYNYPPAAGGGPAPPLPFAPLLPVVAFHFATL